MGPPYGKLPIPISLGILMGVVSPLIKYSSISKQILPRFGVQLFCDKSQKDVESQNTNTYTSEVYASVMTKLNGSQHFATWSMSTTKLDYLIYGNQ